jgi:alpha-D-ribose 1-methylphosphonate 5-triphosphate synthase subunit PhnG
MSQINDKTKTNSRKEWLGILARASTDELEKLLSPLISTLKMRWVRPPEIGMIMLRARIGGIGDLFNMGEATITRCAVQLEPGALGIGYTLGREKRKAELIAIADALLQDTLVQNKLLQTIISTIKSNQTERIHQEQSEMAKSKVEFFTMVRGDS